MKLISLVAVIFVVQAKLSFLDSTFMGNEIQVQGNEYESYPTFWFQLHRRKLCFLKIYTHIVKIYLFSKRAWFAPNAFLAAAAVNIISILKLDFNPIQKMVTPKERKKEI